MREFQSIRVRYHQKYHRINSSNAFGKQRWAQQLIIQRQEIDRARFAESQPRHAYLHWPKPSRYESLSAFRIARHDNSSLAVDL